VRHYRVGKLYQPGNQTRILAFDNYETLKDWAGGYAVGGARNITGPFLVLERKETGDRNIHLHVLYENQRLWVDVFLMDSDGDAY